MFSHGSQIGWGATCGKHANEGESKSACKRQLTYGARRPLSDSECRVRLKTWLLAGVPIEEGPYARELHFAVPVRDAPGPFKEEAELDLEVQEFFV